MSERERDARTKTFCERLRALDAGGRARLKRNAGRTLGESRDALGLFYSVLPFGVPLGQEETYFLAATLFPIGTEGGTGDLGAALRRAVRGENEKGLDRRVRILLDADESQLPFRLRQAVRFLAASRVSVDWEQLLDDLLGWHWPNRPVQRRWARSYFASEQPISSNNNP